MLQVYSFVLGWLATLRCLVNISPQLVNFSILSDRLDLIGTPRLVILKKMTVLLNSSSNFLSLFQGKLACFCIYFSFMANCLCSIRHFKAFLKFQRPFY